MLSDPYNSEFIKFAILQKKIPIGDTNATTSRYSKTSSLFFFAKIILAIIIPKNHHEKTFLLAKF